MKTIPECPFCHDNIKSKTIAELNSVVACEDTSPVTPDHLLIIPKRHCMDFFHMTPEEQMDANNLLTILSRKILKDDPSITGFNIGINNGESAGQTIFHCHIHLIPRRNGDTPEPRGGIRGVIPDKMNY
jgi:ATP adenylyltransferase